MNHDTVDNLLNRISKLEKRFADEEKDDAPETERDNARFYAYERVEQYGEDYKEYSRRLTITQAVIVILLFPVYLAAGNDWAMLLCMVFALFIAFQFHAGIVAYHRLFMLGRGALRREYYPEEDINSDGAHWWINLWFGGRTLTFYALMFYTINGLVRAIIGA